MSSQKLNILKSLLNDDLSLEKQMELLQQLPPLSMHAKDIAAICDYLLQQANLVSDTPADTIDLTGTGGDGFDTFNISTTSAFVIAGHGIKIAKHGNRAATSRSGCFDCLDALGVKIPQSASEVSKQLNEKGISFVFGPLFHPCLKKVAAARKELGKQGKKTIFNVIGPLLNPVSISGIVLGVFDKALITVLSDVLKIRNIPSAIVLNGNGLDEVTLAGETQFTRLQNGKLEHGSIEASDYGLSACDISDLKGGDATENSKLTLAILNNQLQGPKRDIVVANAAMAIMMVEKTDYADAIAKAQDSIDSGRAIACLESMK